MKATRWSIIREAKRLYEQLKAEGVVADDFVVDVWVASSSGPQLRLAEIMVTSLQQIGIEPGPGH